MRTLICLSKNILFYLLSGLFLFSGCTNPPPQEPGPERRKSPIAIAKTSHEPSDTYIKIVYGQPYKKDREIFGELVPYEEVWRTGANEATELTTTNDLTLGGKSLAAGTYSVFTIPKEENIWTIILNSELGQWGAFDYDPSFDVLRVDVPQQANEKSTEAFTIRFSEIIEDQTNIIIEWGKTEISIPIEFTN